MISAAARSDHRQQGWLLQIGGFSGFLSVGFATSILRSTFVYYMRMLFVYQRLSQE